MPNPNNFLSNAGGSSPEREPQGDGYFDLANFIEASLKWTARLLQPSPEMPAEELDGTNLKTDES